MNRGLIVTLTLAGLWASAVAAPRLAGQEVVLLDRTLTLSAESGRYRLLEYRNAQWYGSTFRSEEHTSELQSHSFISYAVFCLKKKKQTNH